MPRHVRGFFIALCKILKMFSVLLLSIVILSVAILGMSVFLFFKGRKFPNSKIGHNKKMREKGIECVFSQDHKARYAKDYKSPM